MDRYIVSIVRDMDPEQPLDCTDAPVGVISYEPRQWFGVPQRNGQAPAGRFPAPASYTLGYTRGYTRGELAKAVRAEVMRLQLQGFSVYDSGHGFMVYANKKQYLAYAGCKPRQVVQHLKEFATDIQCWAQGDVYGYRISEATPNCACPHCACPHCEGTHEVDSCWGFYGWDAAEAAANEAKRALCKQ